MGQPHCVSFSWSLTFLLQIIDNQSNPYRNCNTSLKIHELIKDVSKYELGCLRNEFLFTFTYCVLIYEVLHNRANNTRNIVPHVPGIVTHVSVRAHIRTHGYEGHILWHTEFTLTKRMMRIRPLIFRFMLSVDGWVDQQLRWIEQKNLSTWHWKLR